MASVEVECACRKVKVHPLALTYAPKIVPVYKGAIRTSIRITERFRLWDKLELYTWGAKPYYSKWVGRTIVPISEIYDIRVFDWGIAFLAGDRNPNMQYSSIWENIAETKLEFSWLDLDWLAKIDGIVPATGPELGKLLLKMHRNKMKESNETFVVGKCLVGQIVGWDWNRRERGRGEADKGA